MATRKFAKGQRERFLFPLPLSSAANWRNSNDGSLNGPNRARRDTFSVHVRRAFLEIARSIGDRRMRSIRDNDRGIDDASMSEMKELGSNECSRGRRGSANIRVFGERLASEPPLWTQTRPLLGIAVLAKRQLQSRLRRGDIRGAGDGTLRVTWGRQQGGQGCTLWQRHTFSHHSRSRVNRTSQAKFFSLLPQSETGLFDLTGTRKRREIQRPFSNRATPPCIAIVP